MLSHRLATIKKQGESTEERQMISPMQFLHENGVIHRDLKPSNIVFDSNGCPKIVDFGLIKRIEDDSDFSSAATHVGTAFYSAPEMQGLFPNKKLDYVADVYSLGVILYELITGSCEPPKNDARPGRVNRMVNGSLDQICLGCLQVNPDRRYDVPRLLKAIERYRQGLYPVPVRYPQVYPKVQLGDHEINVVRVLGGDVVGRWGRPFTIESVTDWMLELLQLSGLSHTAIYSLYQSLIHEYPNQINEINRRLCKRK